ncbi:Outer membrane receptor proteins, mostly Fe transport [Ekhidna lutea]|uniref:Outer membrane receptor proteins, mostly Fe transport n=1 Tax=Ekhidna lutea TaxID=447679 RepID=A0A239K321_EKHLU|nr:TonB-dependent receptor [Ekhidna lutea]SNT12495.1 Outer membrane receptor proteins, mostly Fe transport [Ekhidna lutea]
MSSLLYAQQGALQSNLIFWGEISLFQSLDSLRTIGIPIAYSRDKLTNQTITVTQGITVKQFLDQLSNDRIADIQYDGKQIIISPHIPRNYTIHGVLRNVESGEHIIGATVQVLGTRLGTTTNGYGYYSITLNEGEYQLEFSHINYQRKKTEVSLYRNSYLDISTTPKVTELDEVEVNTVTDDANLIENIPSINRIVISGPDGQIPYLLGEVDVIQNALLKPGIRAIGEDASGLHVRGGGVDQNLTLLDEATIYNPNHFYGLISIFNPEAVNNVRILKGFIPPSYGGRTSSVIEVRQKEGNMNETRASGGIGILSARALVEGPLHKGKSSFLISSRQSLLNLSIDDFASTSVRRNRIRFQDLNVKLNFKYSQSSTYYLSGYVGNDRNQVGLNSTRNWGNRMLNFRWNYLFSPKLFSNISAFVSEYNYKIESTEEPGAFVGRSKIADYSIKTNLSYLPNPNNELSFGFSTIYHRLLPGSREPFDQNASTNTIELENEQGLESAAHFGHEMTTDGFSFHYGLRVSGLHTLGPGTVYQYRDGIPSADSTITDTIQFKRLDIIEKNINLEPRISLNWKLNGTTSLKASFTRTAQYLHLISNTISPAPTDIWKLSSEYIPPTTTNQYTLGLYKNLKDNTWELSSEVYYKDIGNNIQYKNGADLVFNENIETELLLSQARAYGLELYAKKKTGKLKGWISYTLSKAESRIPEFDDVRFVVENHDKTHDFSTSWSMGLSDRLSASANFVFNTGIPVTLPTDKYEYEGNLIPHFQFRNNARLPDYHRLDVSFKWDGKKVKKSGEKRKNDDYWILTIYNVYARQNAYSYFYRESPIDPGTAQVVKYSIFGTIIPAITYNFRF